MLQSISAPVQTHIHEDTPSRPQPRHWSDDVDPEVEAVRESEFIAEIEAKNARNLANDAAYRW